MGDQVPAPEIIEVIYRHCRNCGKIMTLPKDSKQVYCSKECAVEFSLCPVCGSYFTKTAEDQQFCSPACAETHPEYDAIWKEFE